jgi:hypothetical protein
MTARLRLAVVVWGVSGCGANWARSVARQGDRGVLHELTQFPLGVKPRAGICGWCLSLIFFESPAGKDSSHSFGMTTELGFVISNEVRDLYLTETLSISGMR